jgi:drug/metabolite transporter (DMT)-like permease
VPSRVDADSDSLTGILFACLAGMFFGVLNVTMRRGLARVADVDAGSAVIATLALVPVVAAAAASGSDFDAGELWPFLLLGAFVPGLSQLLVVHAVQAAGASRAGILFGMTPLFSALMAIVAFGEPLRWPLAPRDGGARRCERGRPPGCRRTPPGRGRPVRRAMRARPRRRCSGPT